MAVSSESSLERALSLAQDTKERRIALCEKVLSTYSPSGEEGELARFIFSELKERDLKPSIDSAGNVLCETGAGKSSVLFCGHMDTVPGELPVKREGSMLYGRGACDAKGALLSMIFAFEDIASEFKIDPKKASSGRVMLACVTEEERNSEGLNNLITNNIMADAAIFGEPCGAGKVTIGYRGHIPSKVEVETKEVHGSAPWLSNNAAEVAFSTYEKVKALWPNDGQASTESVSVALTQIHAGSTHNVSPGKASMTLDIRVPSGVSTVDVISKIRSVVSDVGEGRAIARVDFGSITEPYKTRMNSNLVRAISRSMIKSGLSKPSFVTKSGTGDMNTYALSFGVDAITYGPGDTRLSHTTEERVDIEEIFACSNILRTTAFELFSLERSE